MATIDNINVTTEIKIYRLWIKQEEQDVVETTPTHD